MGLLDDAIREHLELKRRHGADAGEVARQEHEALGPVRREDIAIPDPAATALADPEDEFTGFESAGANVHEAPTALLPAADPQPAEPDPDPEVEATAILPPAAQPGQPTVSFSLEDLQAAGSTPASPSPEPAGSSPAPALPIAEPGPAEPAAEDPHLSWDAPAVPEPAAEPATPAADVVPADGEGTDHDELEETPDFLQETPEHDRLWFEQKPPKDFDF